jgi:hypothetical protein
MTIPERLPLLPALCVALALVGCGGNDGGGEQRSSRTSTAGDEQAETTEAPRPEQRQQSGGGQPKRPARQETSAGSPEPGAKAVAPGVPVQPAGDNSIQTFGVEGKVDQREQALTILRAYLSARAAGRWAEACAVTSRQFKREVAMIAAGMPKKKQPKGCAATLRFFFHRIPRTALRVSAKVMELLSFRVKGRYAYIIFRGAEDKVDYIAMRSDDGVWKINTANPEAFPLPEG